MNWIVGPNHWFQLKIGHILLKGYCNVRNDENIVVTIQSQKRGIIVLFKLQQSVKMELKNQFFCHWYSTYIIFFLFSYLTYGINHCVLVCVLVCLCLCWVKTKLKCSSLSLSLSLFESNEEFAKNCNKQTQLMFTLMPVKSRYLFHSLSWST